MSDGIDPTKRDLAKVIDEVRTECLEGLEHLKVQVQELQKTVSDNNRRIARLIKLIDDAQQTILIIEHAASELNVRIASAEKRVDAAANAAAINKQNLNVLSNYVKQLAKQFKEMSDEIDDLKDEVETHSIRWKRLSVYAMVIAGFVAGVIWVVHEYVGWIHLFEIFGK